MSNSGYRPVALEERRPSPDSTLEEWPTSSSERGARSVSTQRNVLAGTVVVLLLALMGQSASYHLSTPSRSLASSTTADGRPPHGDNKSQPWDSLLRGHWRPPSTSNWTEEDVRRRWGSGSQGNVGAGGRRRLEIASSFEWQPEEGEVAQWDSWSFIKRCMNSQKGLILLGDSVQSQAFEALRGMLNLAGDGYDGASGFYQKNIGEPPYPALFATESTSALLHDALPHVPVERFQQPFVTRLRHDTLLNEDELRPISEQVDVREKFIFKSWLQTDSWERALPKEAGKRWRGERHSVLFLNTGAHWSRACLGQDEQGLIDLTREAARSVLTRLATIPSLDVVYRATSPPARHCEVATTPVYPALPFEDHHSHPDWSWSSFGQLNDLWAEEIERLPTRAEQMVFLNITEMAGQRPEAHTGEGDCLHWALPGVPGVWIELLWTIIKDS